MAKKRTLKVLVTSQPIVTHVRPLQPVTQLAMDRGHDVRFAAPAKPELERIARVGYSLPYGPMGHDWTADPAALSELGNTLVRQGNDAFCHLLFGKYMIGDSALPMAEGIVGMARSEWRPDLIIHDVSEHGAYLAGQYLGIPTISMDNGLGRLIYELHGRTIRPVLNRLRERMGLGAEPSTPGSFHGLLTTRAPREFLYHGLNIPTLKAFRHQNPVRRNAQLPAWVDRIPADRPFVYVMLGSSGWGIREFKPLFEQANRLVFEALGDKPVEVLASVGEGNVGAYGNVPRNIHLVEYAAQPEALERAALYVGHGGYGGLCEAIVAETPMVLLHQFADQRPNAEQVVRNGMGIMLDPRTSSPDAVSQACERVLFDRQYHRNMVRMNRQMSSLHSMEQVLVGELRRFGF